ncbi:glycoside hydrolase family 57 [Thermovibrio ammonificans HB-1]|uniref:Glycoside hydrolase family 57 n=1 Tax=Thermovibrio ammonificans (strain DSM 15698 / JCM 12110 / HB-1) TaxID=648996 RepID=E8T249_THEA1|nr:glycoside hydrolase family 57 protein [Thermovibrio ammonificans]ADU96944.1 glycoside hydrolase family 57 [Thermovibrio ammonificans HB-1]
MDRGERVKLVLLWHMHQPLYRNGITGEYEMPWVFLHGIKDYYDMAWHASKFEGLKVTFNLTPVLIKQLKEYGEGKANCKFLELMKRPVKELQNHEKRWLLQFLFHGNVETMVKPFKHYYELFLRFERESQEGSFLKNLTSQDFLNLEVLFLLSWCGRYLRENSRVVKRLVEKESVFSEEEKLELIGELLRFTGKVIPLYSRLSREGKVEVSTTPYYHPILPLLLNIEAAKESTPDVRLPALHVNFKDDAELQTEKAIKEVKELFDFKGGVWPAEGGVSEEALKLLKEKGANWCATDEEVLFKSLSRRFGTREPLYRVYSYEGLKLLFRDRELSDLIGFVYKSWREDDAVEDFTGRLKRIGEQFKEPVVSVILDGENCWEFYRENGYPFREKLYRTLSQLEWVESVFPSELEATEKLERVVAGSWIGGNFLTWVGDREKNRAWELLGITKLNLEEERENDNYRKAKEKLLAAEGSDWFWWFGKGHYTPFSQTFDRLFRSNLIAVYKLLNKTIPQELFTPISRFKSSASEPPRNFVKAQVDGQVTSYYEWLEAGKVDLLEFSTMATQGFVMRELYYGYDRNGNLYLRVDGDWKRLKGRRFQVVFEISGKEKKSFTVEPNGTVTGCKGAKGALNRILEVEIPAECLSERGRLYLTVKLVVDGKVVEEAPFLSYALLDLSRDFSSEWMV